MSKRLEKIYAAYLKLKDKDEGLSTQKKGDYKMFLNKLKRPVKYSKITPEYRLGELFFVDDFIFLLTGEAEDFYTGFKVSEWVDFATHEDFVFEFNGDKWFAIMEHELYIPRNEVIYYIGELSEEYSDVLFEYIIGEKKLPPKYTGLTIPYDNNYIQVKFRQEEMKKVKHYIANQFTIIDDVPPLYEFHVFKDLFIDKLKKIEYPKAAGSYVSTAKGENFILNYDKSSGILTLLIHKDKGKPSKLKVNFDGEELTCVVVDDMVTFELNDIYVNIEYLVNKIKIIR